jgi:hypothetical protein
MTAFHHERRQTIPAISFWRNWGLPAAAALLLTPMALLAHSYKFVNDDQILYIPFLRRTLNPSLYPGDYFFGQPQATISIFENALAWPVRLLGLEWTMLLGYLLVQALILFCLYRLARRLASPPAAFLAMVLFILPISIGGTFVRTYDNYFNPRTLVLPLSLLTLLALWKRRPWWAAALVSLHLLLHPLSGLHTWLVTVLLLAWWAWRRYFSPRSLIGPGILLLGIPGFLAWKSGGGGALWLDPAWRAVLWERTPYVFLASWKTEDWISLGLYLILGIVGWSARRRDPRTTHLSLAVLGVVLAMTLAVAVGVDWLGLAPLAQLQLARGWRLVIVMAVIFGADNVVVLYERGGWGSSLAAASLAVAIYFDRADTEWQPIFAVLLSAILLARVLEYRWGAKGRLGAEGVLGLAGLGLVIPVLLATWPTVKVQLPMLLADHWRLPDEALWPTIMLFGLLLLAGQIRQPHKRSWVGWGTIGVGSALILVGLFPLAGEWRQRDWSAYLNDRLQLPINDAWMSPTFRAWRETQLWVATHTPPTARFATDPDEKGFRVFSERSPIGEVKDGAAVMFSRTYALEWDRRMQALAVAGVLDPDDDTELNDFSVEGLIALHALYPFDYVVGRQSQTISWPEAYRNQVFVVYTWPEEQPLGLGREPVNLDAAGVAGARKGGD